MIQRRGYLTAVRTTLLAMMCIAVCLIVAPLVSAIATGYASEDNGLQVGMAVSLVEETSDESEPSVERTTHDNRDDFVGIVTTIDASLIAVGSSNSKVFVEDEGQVEAYVSDINGVVKEGDLLTISPLKGVLMRLGDSSLAVLGTAKNSPEQTASYSYEENGATKETQIAKVQINLGYAAQSGASSGNSSLSKLGQTLAGRTVSETRVLIALILFIIVLVAEGGIIYGAVSSAITSLGRNPMAKKVIQGEFLRVAVVALFVLVAGLVAVYAMLRI